MSAQQGAFEVERAPPSLVSTSGAPNLALLQTAQPPVETCYNKPLPLPYAVIGDVHARDVALGVDFLLSARAASSSFARDRTAFQRLPADVADGVMLALRVPQASCEVKLSTTRGFFLFLYSNASWELYNHVSTSFRTSILHTPTCS